MKMTHNQAIELAKQNKWNEAWEVAQQDEGLLESVTFETWKPFAERCIKQEAIQEAVNNEYNESHAD